MGDRLDGVGIRAGATTVWSPKKTALPPQKPVYACHLPSILYFTRRRGIGDYRPGSRRTHRAGKASNISRRDAACRVSAVPRCGRRSKPRLYKEDVTPASQRTNRSFQSRDGNSECGTSRSEHADYRQEARSPSLPMESSARPENRSRSESTRHTE